MNEDELKAQFLKRMADDFLIREEVKGVNIFYQQSCIVDFLAYPKPHLVESGFDAFPFGVEVKSINNDDLQKTIDLFVQAFTYQTAEYPGRNGIIRPMFTLVCVDLENIYCDTISTEFRESWRALLRVGQKLNIGELDISSEFYLWKITFTSAHYFSRHSMQGLKKGNVANVGRKIYVGNTGTQRPLTTDWNGENYGTKRT